MFAFAPNASVCIGASVQKGAKCPFFASESASPVGMHTDATVQKGFCTVFRQFLGDNSMDVERFLWRTK